MKNKTIVIALGGNALVKKGQKGTFKEQLENLEIPIRQIAKLSQKYRIVISFGNGPQVGNLLLQQEACNEVPELPLEILVAQTQGQIGYMIEVTLDNELMRLGIENPLLSTFLSYVQVDKNDPAFKNPTKPIGPIYTKEQAKRLPYKTVKTARGYRRVVASPNPITIVEKNEIKKMLDAGAIVITCGGGGIPVTKKRRKFEGIEAVIDKDLTSAKLAEELNADILMILTNVEKVALNYGKPNQKDLSRLSVEEAKKYLEEGHFPEGSMRPKIEAAVNFLVAGGKKVIISSVEKAEVALKGEAGTEIIL